MLAVARARTSSIAGEGYGLAWVDISTGEFRVAETDGGRLAADIARVDPREIVLSDALYADTTLADFWRSFRAVSPVPRDLFDGATAERRLAGYFGVGTLDGFGAFSRLELTAAAAVATYVERTQIATRAPLTPPVREAAGAAMLIDAATRANLELVRTLGGERQGSLLAAIDRTVTAAGARLLAVRLASPLTDPPPSPPGSTRWRRSSPRRPCAPRSAPALPKLPTWRARSPASPWIVAARATLPPSARGSSPPSASRPCWAMSPPVNSVLRRKASPVLRRPSPTGWRRRSMMSCRLKRDGGFVRAGYLPALDETRALRDESRRVIASLQARYAEETGIRTLKVKHNNVLGYFVEVAQQHGETFLKAPLNETFIHRQTMAGAMRFSTTELGQLEAKIAGAADRALGLEQEVFADLARAVLAMAEDIRAAAEAVAVLDVAASLATLAAEESYCRPLVDTLARLRREAGPPSRGRAGHPRQGAFRRQ